jgi:tetratricopeptide (TPR) repeat protein
VNNGHRLSTLSDRTTTRLIIAAAIVLLIGIPLIAVIYVQDQYRPAGPSLVDREIQAAEAAVRADPNLQTARLALAQLYAKEGRLTDAVEQYDQILTLSPDAGSALLGRASVSVALDALDAAAADFQRIVDLAEGGEMARFDPQLESAHYGLGAIALRQDRPEDAVVHLADAVSINRTDADALLLLGTALLQAGEPQRAVTATERAIALVPIGWCEPYAQVGSAHAALGDVDGSAYGAAMVDFCEGRTDDARAALQTLTSGRHAVDALVGLGLIAETENDLAAALDAYTRAVAIEPDDFAATTGLSRAGGTPPAAPTTAPTASPAAGG